MSTLSDHLQHEKTLRGGRLTEGVVRIGDTVRRPSTANSDFVARLLHHLHAVGFGGAPEYLGQDERGRDMLRYLPGWVPARFQHFTDDTVAAAGRLLRAFHDATRGSALVSGTSVVCHHDAGPNNVVFQNGCPVAFIDFDMAAPGPALDDVGYMGWTWCVSCKPARGPASLQARQVRILADAYGLQRDERDGVFDAMLARQRRNIQFWHERLEGNCAGLAALEAQIIDRIEWSKRELQYTESYRLLFLEALR